jgi:hypothetical protein
MKLPAPIYGLPRRDWPKNVADAPNGAYYISQTQGGEVAYECASA